VKYTPVNGKERLTIGSLKYWAKEDNSELYDLMIQLLQLNVNVNHLRV
jgi:hypothetical protein